MMILRELEELPGFTIGEQHQINMREDSENKLKELLLIIVMQNKKNRH